MSWRRRRAGWAAAAGAAIAIACSGCAAASDAGSDPSVSPSERESTPTPTPSTGGGAPQSLSFDEGADLDPLAAVGWNLSLHPPGEAEWTSDPAAPEGETRFINADGTCTADYWADVFEARARDDRSASDEYLGEVSGAPAADIAANAFDGHFALTTDLDGVRAPGDVATRILSWDSDEGPVAVTVRVFTALDTAASGMANAYAMGLRCANGVDPSTIVDGLDEVAKVTVAAE